MRYYEILKKRRTDLKLSIQDVSAQTRLAPEYIKAIEDNDLDVFSDDLSFVRYFIRSYCEALGVNWSMLQEEVDGSIKHYAHLRNMALTQAQKRMAASMPMDTNESRVRRTGRSSYQNRVASTSRSLSRKPRRQLSMKAVIIAGIILCGGFGLWAGMNQIRASQAAQAQAAADQEAKDKEAETARLAELRRREQGLDNAQPEQEETPKVEDTTTVSGSTVTVTSTFDTPPEVAIEAKFSAPSTVWLTEAGAVLNDTSQYTDSFSQTVTMNAPGTLLFQPAVPEGMKLTVNGQSVTPELNENGEAIITIEVVQAAGAAKEDAAAEQGEQNEPAE